MDVLWFWIRSELVYTGPEREEMGPGPVINIVSNYYEKHKIYE